MKVRRKGDIKFRDLLESEDAVLLVAMYRFAFGRWPTIEEAHADLRKMARGKSLHETIVEIIGRDEYRSQPEAPQGCEACGPACKGAWMKRSEQLLGTKRFEKTALHAERIMILVFIGHQQTFILRETAMVKGWLRWARYWLWQRKALLKLMD